jgi:oxygen-independent coproporphyrinogen-3 oxidase
MTDPAATPSGDEDFGLYVHWPFCLSKCPYCDFNSHVVDAVDQGAWRAALLRELAHVAARTPGRRLTSIFFGGGTPSLMAPETAAALIDAARAAWTPLPDLEITLEANPGTVDAARFEAIRAAGVNRLSMGVQALDDDDLKRLGRRHGVAEARAAWRAAAGLFPRTSFDLIYARVGQGLVAWQDELKRALDEAAACGITHLSLYQLTMEEGTAMAAEHARGAFVLPGEDAAADLYEATQVLCATAGLPAYEISNHAVPGTECRHNLTYWRGGDYAGIGPGAHGRLTVDGAVHATRQIKAPALWLKRTLKAGHGTQEEERLTPRARAEELVMTGLRTVEGIDKARFARLTGSPLAAVVAAAGLATLVREGLIVETPQALRVTARGRLALNAVVRMLLA